MMRIEEKGFGLFFARCSVSVCSPTSFFLRKDHNVRFHFCGGTEPLPTTVLQVSGKYVNVTINMTPAKIAKNQKMAGQPIYVSKSPPTRGPIAGPNMMPILA